MFERIRSKLGGKEDLARRAELEGDLARAVVLWGEAGRPEDAARVMVLRGDAERDPDRRRQHYVQAAALAPEGSPVRADARRKKATLAIAAGRDGAGSAIARHDLLEAGAELEAIGDAARAAEAYALAGDVEGEARALVDAGDVEKLEDVLDRDRARVTADRVVRAEADEIDRLLATGRRREALERAKASDALRDKAQAIEARRATAARGPLEIRGRAAWLALGDEVVVGRSAENEAGGASRIAIASSAVSRRHLAFARDERGQPVLRDLGSRNGTELRGMRVAGALPITDAGIDVKLGGEVPLRAAPTDALVGAIAVEVGGVRWLAPLGPARIGLGAWRIEAAPDGWLELITDDAPPAYMGATHLAPRIALLAGDAIAASRDGAFVVRVPAT